MGVALQVYRLRIGTFQPLIYSKATQSNGTLKLPPGPKLKLAFFFLSLCCFSPIFVHLNEDSFKIKTSPCPVPPTTACGSSSGPSCTPGLPLTLSTCPPPPTDTPPPKLLPTYLQSKQFTNKGCLFQPQPTDTPPPPPVLTSSPCAPSQMSTCTIPFLNKSAKVHLHTVCQLCPHLLSPNSWLTSMERNTLAKATFGNRSQRGRGIKIVMWNKGSSLLQNKHPEIETVIDAHKPHILGLCEANLRRDVDISLVQHQDYQLHAAKVSTMLILK